MPLSVLIVDDHREFRAVARELLEGAGYVVSGEAASAGEALAAVSIQAPDVVLLDVVLPDGSGFDVATQISRDPRGPVVVLVSSREAEDYGQRVSGCGARGFVSKSRLSAATLASVLA
jgi:CheY-like chemotaxis protein